MESKHCLRLASLDGLGIITNATGDYSSAANNFIVKPEPGETIQLHRLIVHIVDGNIDNSDDYGGLGSPLANGITVEVRDSEGLLETLTAFPIKSNGDWAGHCHDVTVFPVKGLGNEHITVRWTFSKSGAPVTISDRNGQYISIVLNDDFTGLVTHHFQLQGFYTSEHY